MNRTLIAAVVVWVVTSSAHLNAAVFQHDWKVPGDGLLTYDDVNQREWLDLSVSRLSQFPVPRLANAMAEISPGGLFDGFTWASQQDVLALAASSGVDVTSFDLAVNQIPVTNVIGLLSPTLQNNLGVLRSVGLTNDPRTNPSLPPYTGAAFLVNFNPSTGGGYAEFALNLPDDLLTPLSNGMMLYRVVPEPALTLQFAIAAWLLLWRPKRT